MQLYFGLLAFAFLAASLWLFARRWMVTSNGSHALGHVVDHELRRVDDADCYFPVVEFADRDGRPQRFTAVAGDSVPRPAVGATVTVRYHPHAPEQAFIASFLHMWAAPYAMLALGLGALIACAQA